MLAPCHQTVTRFIHLPVPSRLGFARNAKLRGICLLLFSLLLGISLFSSEAQAQPTVKQDIQLPAQQKTPILVFDESGGIRIKANEQKAFQLFADGKVIARNGRKIMRFQLKQNQLQQLLKFIIQEQAIYAHSTQQIRKEIAADKSQPKIRLKDAPVSQLWLDLPRGKHEVKVEALFLVARYHAKCKGVQSLQNIKIRIGRLVAEEFLGDKAEAIVKVVNSQLKEKNFGIKPVTLEELRTASETVKGGTQARFSRPHPNPEKKDAPEISISYYQSSPNEKPLVRVFGLQKE